MTVSVIVVVLEVLDHHPGLEQSGPVVAVQTLIAQPVVERFDEPVVPRRTRRNVGHPHRPSTEVPQRFRDELKARCPCATPAAAHPTSRTPSPSPRSTG